MSELLPVVLTVNGVPHTAAVPPRLLLADLLREHLGLTGTHLGCGHGTCGSCTVVLDGEPVRSCLMLAVQADGSSVTTVEGVAGDGPITPVQQAINDNHGMQCGFCTPGVVCSLTALLDADPAPSDEAITDTLDGHLCRCTGYQNIVKAARQAAGRPVPEVAP
ncbi:(2Fe-2S)-binding protein [Pseudonocardia kongjuensis]|uniref:(2Fe-2S)-binding protein n=1 Tax=Pseudonocardia kongjuensis TaxID=102227 RepID=A0ABN1XFF8_9PSEU